MSSLRVVICAASALWLAAAACTDEPSTGQVRAHYALQNPGGDALSCQAAGIAAVRIGLYADRLDPQPAFEEVVGCATDEAGAGTGSWTTAVGFYDSVRVALLDGSAQVATLATGEPARWEYLTVELTGGGVMELLPPVIAVFDATALD